MPKDDNSVFAMLVRATALAQRAAADQLFEIGVSPFEQWLLEAVTMEDNACASELAAMLEVPTSTVTRTLRRLESVGYVTLRKGVFADARVLRARLTPRGEMICRAAEGFEQDIDRQLLADVPPPAVGHIVHALGHLLRTAKKAAAGPAS